MKKKLLLQAGFLLTCVSLTTLAIAQNKRGGPPTRKSVATKDVYITVENDTTVVPVQKIINYRDSIDYEIKIAGDNVTALIVNGKTIPKTDYGNYSPIIKRIRERIKKDEEMATIDRKQALKDRDQARLDELQSKKDEEQTGLARKKFEEDQQLADEERLRGKEDREQKERDEKMMQEDRQQLPEDDKQAEEDRGQAARDREQVKLDRKQAAEDRVLMKGLTDDLINENIIRNENDLVSFVLDEYSLTVNEKKQPENIFQKFKTKFLKKSRSEIRFENTRNKREMSVKGED